MNGKLAIIHTTPITVASLKELAAELLPGCEIVNLMDDSILPQLAATDGDLSVVRERLLAYARIAENLGAACILNACSSVGGVVAEMRKQVGIPVVRIDEAMAERAVRGGKRVGVAATLATTLRPTITLLEEKASEAGAEVTIVPALAEEAYKKLLGGDKEGHDAELGRVLTALAEETDVVVLAQASMARVVERMPEPQRARFLSSPRMGMESAALRMGLHP